VIQVAAFASVTGDESQKEMCRVASDRAAAGADGGDSLRWSSSDEAVRFTRCSISTR